MTHIRTLSLFVAAIVSVAACAYARASDAETALDHLFALCTTLGKQHQAENCFNRPEFWRESKRVADQTGPQIIAAVMRRARKWPASDKAEGPWLILLPLVALLPRDASVELLRRYERSTNQAERLWAHEYLIEFNMVDTAEAVKTYSSGHK